MSTTPRNPQPKIVVPTQLGVRPGLRVSRTVLTLEFLAGGDLVPWLGPALRGLSLEWKRAVCVHPPHLRDTHWIRCNGCPEAGECSYGIGYEPQPRATPEAAAHHLKATPRLLILRPAYPMPERATPGLRCSAELLLIGPATNLRDEFLMHLDRAGQQAGLGDRTRVPFRVASAESSQLAVLRIEDLPTQPAGNTADLGHLQIELTTPLLLRVHRDGRLRVLHEPSLLDLWRASYRVLSNLFLFHARPLEVNARDWVPSLQACSWSWSHLQSFQQGHSSRRHMHKRTLEGITGRLAVQGLPAAALPWLHWGGALGVGEYRPTGAGSWRIHQEGAS